MSKHVMVGVEPDDGTPAQKVVGQYQYRKTDSDSWIDCFSLQQVEEKAKAGFQIGIVGPDRVTIFRIDDFKSPEQLLAESVARETALRDELGAVKGEYDRAVNKVDALQRRLDSESGAVLCLQERLTAAEQRNAQLEPLKDCLVALESIIAAVDRCEEDQDVGLADVFTQRLEGAAREAIAKAKGLEPALVPFVFSDSPDGAAAEAVYLRQVAAHEVPGTSGQRLNQLANEGE